jgi:hypothetical protein
MNIYEKLSKITEEIGIVAKNFTVGYGKSSYKAVKEGDILNAVKPLEAKYKVYSFPASRKVISEEKIDYVDREGNDKQNLFFRIETVYRFVNVENPEEYVDITSFGDGVDSQDKGCGKAMTYSDKYALMKAYKIETGDDPDQKASEEISVKKPVEQKQRITLAFAMDRKTKSGITFGDLADDQLEFIVKNGNEMSKQCAETILADRKFNSGEETEQLPFEL